MSILSRDYITKETSLSWPRFHSSIVGPRLIEGCDVNHVEGVRINVTWTLCARAASHDSDLEQNAVYGWISC